MLFVAFGVFMPSPARYAPPSGEVAVVDVPPSVLEPACSVEISQVRSLRIDPYGIRGVSLHHTDVAAIENTGSASETVTLEITSGLAQAVRMPMNSSVLEPGQSRTFALLVDGSPYETYKGSVRIWVKSYDITENVVNVSLLYDAARLKPLPGDALAERDGIGFLAAVWESLNQPIYTFPSGFTAPKWAVPLAIVLLSLALVRWKIGALTGKEEQKGEKQRRSRWYYVKQVVGFVVFAVVIFVVCGVFL